MSSAQPNENFYTSLESFGKFTDFTRSRHFVPVPADWYVIVTDVKGSTTAIEKGHYKDVNTIGAASISVVQEELGAEFPFVFGGDGATLLVPTSQLDRALEALLGLRRLSKDRFGLELRVGRVAVSEIEDAGGRIEVAKHELDAGRCTAIFRGGGLSTAESKIKGDEENYCVREDGAAIAQLKGLSCRWNAIPNTRGCVMSLLVMARNVSSTAAYSRFLAKMNGVFGGDLDAANPVNVERMSYRNFGEMLRSERRFHRSASTLGFLMRMLEIAGAVLVFKFRMPPLFFSLRRYRRSMRTHADHRKFDDMLRMVIDCSPDQGEAIVEFLESELKAGEVFYGTHLSETALMTCYVQGVSEGQHIHFIDGADGGYAMAAKQLKAQVAGVGA